MTYYKGKRESRLALAWVGFQFSAILTAVFAVLWLLGVKP